MARTVMPGVVRISRKRKRDEDERPTYNKRQRGRNDIHGNATIIVRRGERANVVHHPIPVYAVLTSADGPEDGPWMLGFELIAERWLRQKVGTSFAYDTRRLRTMLNGRDFDTALANFSIERSL